MKKREQIGDKGIDFSEYFDGKNRSDILLGKNADGTETVLPGYVDVDGVQVHPERLAEYLARLNGDES